MQKFYSLSLEHCTIDSITFENGIGNSSCAPIETIQMLVKHSALLREVIRAKKLERPQSENTELG